ncbi:MAG: hypothetical protein JWM95_3076 [Gemmatimonadetes bacterium]|nr:hypothetical protein [Gemmatimonadota bacterium]
MRQAVCAMALVISASWSAGGQSSTLVEIGMDARLMFVLNESHQTLISVPFQRIRAGGFVSEACH